MNSRRQTSDGGEGQEEESRCSGRCAVTKSAVFLLLPIFLLVGGKQEYTTGGTVVLFSEAVFCELRHSPSGKTCKMEN